MNKIKFLFAAVVVALFTLGIYSCAKEDLSIIPVNNTESRTFIIPEGTVLPTIKLMPTVVSGILKFNSKQHLREFWEDLESADEDQLNLLEQTLGFVSIRSIYNDVNENGSTLPNPSYPFTVDNPSDEIVFNQYHELWVGNDIYKLVEKRLLVRTTAAYVSEIISMRNNGGMVREHTQLIDRNTNETLPEPPVSTRTKCTLSITVPFNPTVTTDGNSVYGYIKPIVIDQNGNEVKLCGGTVSINWGDGSSLTNITGDINYPRTHIYNVGPGECKTFKVKVIVNLSICGLCTGTIESEQNITFCSPVGCTAFEDERSETTVFTSFYGSTNQHRATFRMGYDSDDYTWHDARAWGRIIHETRQSNGSMKKTKPGFRLLVKLHGAAYAESCTGSRILRLEIGNEKSKDLTKMVKFDDINIRFRSDDDMFADFAVFGTSNTTPDLSLSVRPFSTL